MFNFGQPLLRCEVASGGEPYIHLADGHYTVTREFVHKRFKAIRTETERLLDDNGNNPDDVGQNENSYSFNEKVLTLVGPNHKSLRITIDELLTLTQAKGFCFDVDNCLIMSEDAQLEVWKQAIATMTENIGKGQDHIAIQAAQQSIIESLENGDMHNLVPNLYRTALEFKIVPSFVTNASEFESLLKPIRLRLLVECCRNGKINLTPGVAEFVTSLRDKGIKLSIFTSTPRELSIPLLRETFKKNGLSFNDFFPEENRVFGPELKKSKPDPEGWYLAAQRMELQSDDVVILDDRPQILQRAAERSDGKKSFAAVIGICESADNLSKWVPVMARTSFNERTYVIVVSNFESFLGEEGHN